ncbi:heavy-metal-associated domain-containing protein [Mycolicibacterium sp. P9-22]|uniref:heavy-metal-associated domain-containing protein n=1 Tax=Mycolicibacterium sp. P9-22 TaxID=2024613 RepID=UPI0011EE3041|nr:heavy-metal-associated domain-containing protein [Mycolicibacterium sp. P9-22]KAA0112632.1 heavy-metal-associated domain-containing protein [Mycolicibacterium sp. P9-22]
MNAAGRLAVFGAGLAVAFGAAYTTAAAIAPDVPAAAGRESAAAESHPVSETAPAAPADEAGLSLANGGYQLSPVQAPGTVGARGALSFAILDETGQALRDYQTVHDKQLHLIVVRSDGGHFAHVHPQLDRDSGEWSIPWNWDAAGTYRVFADFTPAGGGQLTLTRTVDVPGTFSPSAPIGVRTVDHVAGYTVELDGTLAAGTSSQLTARISRDGRPVTALQPYLGAFGHLVALRDGDLAYLHVHPEGNEPSPGDSGGPTVAFAATAPTAGRYLLYLDFRVQDTVHTAAFVVDATYGGDASKPDGSPDAGHSGH